MEYTTPCWNDKIRISSGLFLVSLLIPVEDECIVLSAWDSRFMHKDMLYQAPLNECQKMEKRNVGRDGHDP
jgi:hypothetical protein